MIKIENVTKSYNGEAVLKGVSMTVEDGEFVSIMGRSGSGKSTLLSIIGGFLPPDGGQVTYDGVDLFSLSDEETAKTRSNDLGFVFQSFRLIGTLSVEDNILLPSSLSDTDAETVRRNFETYTKKLAISELLGKYPDQLSGGQCQRVAIARALCYEPKVLILDEPTGALDSGNEHTVMEIIREVNRERNTTVIMVTHSETVAGYAKRKIVLRDGLIG